MTDNKIRQKVFDAIKKETGVDPSTIDPDKDFRQQVNLDSMQFVAIAARIEHELGVELPIGVVTVNTLNEFVNVVNDATVEV